MTEEEFSKEIVPTSPAEGEEEIQEVEPVEAESEKLEAGSEHITSLSDEANSKKWDVKNPKGRIASVLSLILWSLLLVMLIIKGNWNIGPLLLAVLFVLLLVLSGVRFSQEWKENGDWLDDDVVENV